MPLYLTEEQTEYILEKFFKNEHFAGWKRIAEKLIVSGKCIVAGEKCIWDEMSEELLKEGCPPEIGNFIETKKADDFFGCLEYTFNLESFLKSKWFKDEVEDYLTDLKNEKESINEKITFASSLFKFANKQK